MVKLNAKFVLVGEESSLVLFEDFLMNAEHEGILATSLILGGAANKILFKN